jgi:myo-inositol-1(or 4)-monophosphatase
MSMNEAASLCYIMKDAAFAAGDVLSDRTRGCDACQTVTDVLLRGWFAENDSGVALWADGLAVPMLARRADTGVDLTVLPGESGPYAGPCFAIRSFGGAAFDRGLFDVSVSIAYLIGKRLMAAVVFDPVHVELFHAVSGLGAYLNGKAIAPASTRRMSDACISLSHASLRTGGKTVHSLLCEAAQVRAGASCGLELCYTACGRTDAVVRHNEAFFDYAAGLLVAREAGAVVTDADGGPVSLPEYGGRLSFAAACPGIAGELAGRLAGQRVTNEL